jgi:hypothetical protein
MQQKNPPLIDIGKQPESLTNSVHQRAAAISPSDTEANDPKRQTRQAAMSSSATSSPGSPPFSDESSNTIHETG